MENTTNANVTMDMRAVDQLVSLLKENQKIQEIGMIQNLSSTINDIESNLIAMFSQLQTVKKQLNMATVIPPMQEAKQVAIKEVEESEKSLDKLKGQLNGVKKKFMDTVKTTLDKTKETGVLALDKLSEFTGMKQNLIYLNSAINHSVGNLDKSIASVNALSVELNATGSHLKNIGRVVTGKDAQEHTSESKGTFAKPLEGIKKALITMKEKSNGVISKLDNLSDRGVMIKEKAMENKYADAVLIEMMKNQNEGNSVSKAKELIQNNPLLNENHKDFIIKNHIHSFTYEGYELLQINPRQFADYLIDSRELIDGKNYFGEAEKNFVANYAFHMEDKPTDVGFEKIQNLVNFIKAQEFDINHHEWDSMDPKLEALLTPFQAEINEISDKWVQEKKWDEPKKEQTKPLQAQKKPSVIEKLKEKPQPKQTKVKVKTKAQNMER